MPGPLPLSFDVTDALPSELCEGRRITIAAWLFLPDDLSTLGPVPTLMALLHGGSYDKRYFHFDVPGRSGYSCAEHLAGLGNIVLLADFLGAGESARLPAQRKATRQVAALANHAAVTQLCERLKHGDPALGLAPLTDVVRIGGGHSLGGMLTITQQAEHRTYDAVMILGYTAVGVHRLVDGKPTPVVIPQAAPLEDYICVDRKPLHASFHWPDVPADVIAADDALAVPVPALLGRTAVEYGVVSGDVGRIETPVYICQAELDNSPDPHAEPSYYRASHDVTLHILPRSGHCQNFASTRREMWDRMHSWSRSVAGRRARRAE